MHYEISHWHTSNGFMVPQKDKLCLSWESEFDFVECKLHWKSTSGTFHFGHMKKQESAVLSLSEEK